MAFAASASILAATIASSASAQSAQNSASDGSTIVVTGQRQAYVGDLPVRDIPQNIQSISGNVLKDIGITRMDKALDLVSGVSHMNNYGGLWDAYSFRGFAGDANNVPSGFLVNGFAARGFAGPRDTSSIERMDVLKGPTSALFGRGEPGGTVSIITKKPEFKRKGSISFRRAAGTITVRMPISPRRSPTVSRSVSTVPMKMPRAIVSTSIPRRYFSRHRLFGKLATRPAFLTNWNLHHRKFRSIAGSPSTTVTSPVSLHPAIWVNPKIRRSALIHLAIRCKSSMISTTTGRFCSEGPIAPHT
jgi:hypothetical protein